MSSSDTLTLGLAPALTVEEVLRFGPLTLSPVGQSGDDALRAVAARFARERGAHPERQALVTCPENLRPLVLTVWPLFVFACVTYARRREHSPPGVTFPENFHLLSVTSTPHGLVYDSGHSLGIGDAEHVPLRWPVDDRATLREGWWDRRIERACRDLAKDPAASAANATVVAAGMAADLACAAMERRNQKVENVATGARTYVLLGSAFEALHCKGSSARHTHADVIKGVERLNPGSTSLGDKVFSEAGIERPPRPEPGTETTRPMFAVAQLVYLRNTYAHGRAPAASDFTLPPELNGCHPMHAATLILAALVGDELLNVVGWTSEPFAAMYEGEDLLEALAEAIIPAGP